MRPVRNHLTLRWVFDSPHPRKIMLGDAEIRVVPMCHEDGCRNRFPECREFFVFGGDLYCHACVSKAFTLPETQEGTASGL